MTRPRQISDEDLLEAAHAVFVEQGAGASTSLVAERAGVSQAVLFQRFGTKEKLLRSALAPPRDLEWLQCYEQGPDDRDMRVQLRELAGEISTHFERIMPAMVVLKAAGMSHSSMFEGYDVPPPLRGHHIMRDWFASARDAGRIGTVDPSALAMTFVGALQSRVFLTHLAGNGLDDGEQEAYLDALVELLWRGLAPEVA